MLPNRTVLPRRTLALLAAWTLAAGCAPPDHDEAVLRFVDQPAQELWEPSSLLRSREVRQWSLGIPGELARWTVRNADRERAALASGLTLRSSKRHVRLWRSVDLKADEIDAFELELAAARGLTVTLDWARRGERFSLDRRLSLASRQLLPGTETTARFEVAGHPLWSGTIRRLRIGLGGPPERPVTVRRLTALEETPNPDALIAAMQRPWLVNLERETRSALLAPPGLPIERPLTVPKGARLSFGYAIPAGLPGPVRLRAVFAEEEGDRELFSDVTPPDRAATWLQAEVDLADLAQREGTLRLETELIGGGSTGAYDPYRDGLPVWSSPEVIAPARRGGRRRPNVVLISIDTLRADGLSLYGNPRPTSPHLDAWARSNATIFESAVAAAPWTLPAHVSLLSGLEAYRHGVNYGFPPPSDIDTLAESLHRAGYRTLAVTGGSFLDPRFGLAQGFDRYRYFSRRVEGDPNELETGLADAAAFLAESPKRPFFLFFHTYEVHAPYRARQPFFDRFAGYRPSYGVEPSPQAAPLQEGSPAGKPLRAVAAEPSSGTDDSGTEGSDGGGTGAAELPADGAPELATLARDLYDSSVAFTDDRLQHLFAALAEHGLEEHTLIVVTSDHGELLGEHGLAGHSYLYDENLLVPLMIAAPGRGAPRGSAGRRVGRQVRQVDVLPTVLELAGLPVPDGLDGRSLVPLMAGDEKAAVPDAAVTYMPQPRRGAAIRVDNRSKQWLRTNAWAGLYAESTRYDLASDPGEARPMPPDALLDQRLRRLLTRGYRGLALEIAAGSEGLAVEIEGAAVSLRGVQSLDAACRCVSWLPEGFARVTADPETRLTLRFEEPAGRDLVVRVLRPGGGEGAEFSARLQLYAAKPQRVVRRGGRWQLDTDPPPGPLPAAGVELRWYGPPPRRPITAGAEGRSQLRDELRALGYL